LAMRLRHGRSLRLGGGRRELEDVPRSAVVPSRASAHETRELWLELGSELCGTAAHGLAELLVGERLELVDLGARDECGVDLVVRVLGRRADQRHEARLHPGKERVLLRLVEAVDLVEKEDRAPSGGTEPFS